MRTIPEIDAAAAAFATTMIDKTETAMGYRFQSDLRTTIVNAIEVGYQQGVLDERDELLNGGRR